MAGQSSKKQAASNVQILKQTHTLVWSTLFLSSLSIFYFHRPSTSSKPFLIISLPLTIGSLFILEKTGRPSFEPSTNKVIRSGQDLSQQGVTEYLFDVIYLGIILQILSIVFGSNKPYWVYLAIPIFAGYKLYNLFNYGKELFGSKKNQTNEKVEGSAKQEKSKRQQKLEARGDKQKVRYR